MIIFTFPDLAHLDELRELSFVPNNQILSKLELETSMRYSIKLRILGVGLQKVFSVSLLLAKNNINCFPAILIHVRNKFLFEF